MVHQFAGFRKTPLKAMTLKSPQTFLCRKTKDLSRSSEAHLGLDLRAIFKLAVAEGYAQRDPSNSLYIPKGAVTEPTRARRAKAVQPLPRWAESGGTARCIARDFRRYAAGEILGLQRQVKEEPEAWVFESENPKKPLWRDDIWYRHLKPKPEAIRLELEHGRSLRSSSKRAYSPLNGVI